MRFYDLFCGIGGFRLGLERCGHKHVGSCEIDDYARKIYCKNFGAEPTEKDIRMVDPKTLPDFDILTAGFPCQAFSIAGRRQGFDDERGNLFFEIARIVKEKRPKTLLLENVKGLLNHDKGRTFATILITLYELGYDVEWQVINGKYFVPQNRERIFIVGHSREKPFRQVFPIREGDTIHVKTQSEAQGEGERIRSPYTRALDANYAKGGGSRTMIKTTHLVNSDIEDCRIGVMLTEKRTEHAKEIRRRIRQETGRDYNPRRDKIVEPRNDDLSGCLTTTSTVDRLLLTKDRIRSLTPLECERLMGFPDNWTEGLSDTRRYKCLGNAVIPSIIEKIATYI